MSVATATTDFRTDLAHADHARLRLETGFYPHVSRDGRFVGLDRSPGSLNIQRNCHVDCIVASKQGGSITVEEKLVRWPGYRYTAMTVETHSNLERTGAKDIGDGWIATSTADFLLYGFCQEDGRILVWLFDLPKLREWFVPVASNYRIADTPNTRYTTRCRVVPLADVPAAAVRMSNRMV
jgi:hypothetical protein